MLKGALLAKLLTLMRCYWALMIAVIQDKTPLSPLTSRHHEKEDKTKRAQTQIPLDTVSLVHQTDV
jgi:hypothetical protein